MASYLNIDGVPVQIHLPHIEPREARRIVGRWIHKRAILLLHESRPGGDDVEHVVNFGRLTYVEVAPAPGNLMDRAVITLGGSEDQVDGLVEKAAES